MYQAKLMKKSKFNTNCKEFSLHSHAALLLWVSSPIKTRRSGDDCTLCMSVAQKVWRLFVNARNATRIVWIAKPCPLAFCKKWFIIFLLSLSLNLLTICELFILIHSVQQTSFFYVHACVCVCVYVDAAIDFQDLFLHHYCTFVMLNDFQFKQRTRLFQIGVWLASPGRFLQWNYSSSSKCCWSTVNYEWAS